MQNNDERGYDDFRATDPRTPPSAWMMWSGVAVLVVVMAFAGFALFVNNAEAGEYRKKVLTNVCITEVVGTVATCSKGRARV